MGGRDSLFLCSLLVVLIVAPLVGCISIPIHSPPFPSPRTPKEDTDICLPCVNFLFGNMNDLIKILSTWGYLSCSEVCSKLNNTTDASLCTTLCDLVGYDKFWKIFERADIDPILACQLIEACEVLSNPAALLDIPTITPMYGSSGQLFNFTIKFQVINATGVGQLAYAVYFPVENRRMNYEELFESYQPGVYSASLTLQTYANASFPAGLYPVLFTICAGECGGKGPFSLVLDSAQSSFNLTSAPHSKLLPPHVQ